MTEAVSEEGFTVGSRDVLEMIGPAAGVAMQAVLWTTIAIGVLLSTTFTWPTDPFSIVGSTGDLVAAGFNAGLVLTGLLGLLFAAWLRRIWRPALGGLYALIGLSFSLAGAFPMPSDFHAAATGIFVFGWLLLWAAGIADWRSGERLSGALEVVLGAAAVGIWLPYDVGWTWAQVGYAAAETVSFAAIGVWTIWVGVQFRRS